MKGFSDEGIASFRVLVRIEKKGTIFLAGVVGEVRTVTVPFRLMVTEKPRFTSRQFALVRALARMFGRRAVCFSASGISWGLVRVAKNLRSPSGREVGGGGAGGAGSFGVAVSAGGVAVALPPFPFLFFKGGSWAGDLAASAYDAAFLAGGSCAVARLWTTIVVRWVDSVWKEAIFESNLEHGEGAHSDEGLGDIIPFDSKGRLDVFKSQVGWGVELSNACLEVFGGGEFRKVAVPWAYSGAGIGVGGG